MPSGPDRRLLPSASCCRAAGPARRGCAPSPTRRRPAAAVCAPPRSRCARRWQAAARARRPDQARRDQRATRIERLLASLDDATLARDAARCRPAIRSTTSPAARCCAAACRCRVRFDRGDWRFDAATRPPRPPTAIARRCKLAVLLPLSGNLAAAARPVRDGFLAGYYGESRRRPAAALLRHRRRRRRRALAAYAGGRDGNDFVVGPLGRDEVDAVFAGEPGTAGCWRSTAATQRRRRAAPRSRCRRRTKASPPQTT